MKTLNKYSVSFFLFLLLISVANISAQDKEIDREKYSGIKLFYDFERSSLQLDDRVSGEKPNNKSIIIDEKDYEKLVSWLESRQSFVTMYSDSKMSESTFFIKNSGEEIIPAIANVDLPVNMPVKVSLKNSENLKMEEMLIYDEKLK